MRSVAVCDLPRFGRDESVSATAPLFLPGTWRHGAFCAWTASASDTGSHDCRGILDGSGSRVRSSKFEVQAFLVSAMCLYRTEIGLSIRACLACVIPHSLKSSVRGTSWQVPGYLQGLLDIGSASAHRLVCPVSSLPCSRHVAVRFLAEMFLVCTSVGRRISPLEAGLALSLFKLHPQQLHAVAGAPPGQHE